MSRNVVTDTPGELCSKVRHSSLFQGIRIDFVHGMYAKENALSCGACWNASMELMGPSKIVSSELEVLLRLTACSMGNAPSK